MELVVFARREDEVDVAIGEFGEGAVGGGIHCEL